jgi:aspartate/methionine/tyrosine aminotransferase
MRRLNDLFDSLPPFMSERLSADAFARLSKFKRRADAIMAENYAAYAEIMLGHPALEQLVFQPGTTVFARMRAGGVDAFCANLMVKYDTSVVPGHYFERDDFIRIGLAGETKMTRTGLERLAEALTEHGA